MKSGAVIFILSVLFFSGCGAKDNHIIYEQSMRDEITQQMKKNSNDVEAIKQYFDQRNIPYTVLTKNEQEPPKIDHMMDANDRALFAVYYTDKDFLLTSYYSVYIIYNTENRFKNMIFDIDYMGP